MGRSQGFEQEDMDRKGSTRGNDGSQRVEQEEMMGRSSRREINDRSLA